MDKGNKEELLLYIWIRLDETKSLLSVIEKGLNQEVRLKTDEVHGIISIIKRELEELIKEIDQVV